MRSARTRRSRRRLLLGVLLLALLVPALPAHGQETQGAEKALWGPASLPDGRSAFPVYRDLGVDVLQFTIDWSQTAPDRPGNAANPSDPAYRWPAEIDSAVRQAPRYGIEIALIVHRFPGWTNGGRDSRWAPERLGDWQTFLRAAARRYPRVRKWMIGSEPNFFTHFQPNETGSSVGPQRYSMVLDAAYGALKAERRDNVVIGGMVWTGGDIKPAPWIDQMRLPSGRRPRLDWFGHNPFPFRFPNLKAGPIDGGWRDISDVDTLASDLRHAFRRTVPQWISEFTIQSDQMSTTFDRFVSRDDQARWLTAAYSLANRVRSVRGLGWLHLIDEHGGQGTAKWGLLDQDLRRKPAYDAFRNAPSERFTPRVKVDPQQLASDLRRRGLNVLVTPRTSGKIRATLRRGQQRVRAVSARGRTNRRSRLRLHGPFTPGRYTVEVSADRGWKVLVRLRVR